MTELATTQAFDYTTLEAETRIVVQQRTEEIHSLGRRMTSDLIEMGGKFAQVRDLLRHDKHGGFVGWLEKEGFERRFTYNCMLAYLQFGNRAEIAQLNIGMSALFLLAAPSTDEQIREHFILKAQAGEEVTHKKVKESFTPKPPKFHIGERVWYQGVIYQVSSFTSGGLHTLSSLSGKRLHDIPGSELEAYKPAQYESDETDDDPSAKSATPPSSATADPKPSSTPAAAKAPLTLSDLIRLKLIETGIVPAKFVAHTNGWGGTYSAGFNSNGTREQADQEAQSYAALIEALGYQILNAGADIPPGSATIGMGGENTPIVHFASATYTPPDNKSSAQRAFQSSESNEWYTPKEYADAARDVMGAIDLDPASCEIANANIQAVSYFTRADDGYTQAWHGHVFLNPPYGRDGDNESNAGKWAARLIDAWENDEIDEAILLVNASTGAKWFQALWSYPICFVRGRISFIPSGEPKDSPTHYSAFVYLGDAEVRFREVFERFGEVR